MPDVTFRFYAQLNDFLPPSRRYHRFTHTLAGPASLKDTVEALGVPHPEVDLVLVNGEPGEFGYRLRDGDDVAVYPRYRAIQTESLLRVGSDPPRPVRFVLDVHLRKLASLLRLTGFDAVLRTEDADVAETSAREERVALTRDVGLLKRGVVVHGHWVRHTDPEYQLVEVLDRYDLQGDLEPFTRCLRCNTRIETVDVEQVSGRVPAGTREAFHEFRQCPGCGRIYWQGSHYDRLLRVIDRARQRLVGLS